MTRKRIFDIIQIGNREDFPSRTFDFFISAVIILNITVMFAETFDEIDFLRPACKIIEIITIAVFCIEYILRIWTADLLYPKVSKGKAILRFLVSYDGIVDLLTILPFFFLTGFIMFRMLRVVRIFHLFRINAQYDSFNVITDVIKEKKNQILSSLFIIIVLMLASSVGIYNVEHEVQPEAFKNAFSGLWWSMSTLLTVGYGDIYPITTAGKLMGILIAFLGVGAVAIPTGIISAGFVEHYGKKRSASLKYCDVKNIGEIVVNEENKFSGLSIADIIKANDITVLLIIRGELSITPTSETILKKNDVLVIRTKNKS